MNKPPHACCYCVESRADLVKAANILAKILTRPQLIGHNAKSHAAQYEGARRDLDAINACLTQRFLAEFPTVGIDNQG
jgi:hypothetical protein